MTDADHWPDSILKRKEINKNYFGFNIQASIFLIAKHIHDYKFWQVQKKKEMETH